MRLLLFLACWLSGASGFRPCLPSASLSLRRGSLPRSSCAPRAATKLNDIVPNNSNTTASALSSSSSGGGGNKLKEVGLPILLVAAVVLAAGSQAGGLQTSLTALVDSSVSKIAGMGTWGYLYFAAVSARLRVCTWLEITSLAHTSRRLICSLPSPRPLHPLSFADLHRSRGPGHPRIPANCLERLPLWIDSRHLDGAHQRDGCSVH